MSSNNQKTIKQAIAELFNTNGMTTKLDELKLIDSWKRIMGEPIAKYTKELFIQNRTLHVRLESAALRQELSYAKESIVKKLNEDVGRSVIDQVVFK